MQFHQLKRAHKNKKSVQVGRGGKRGKTSGRGGKGQTARAGHKMRPEMRDTIKRLPKLRGRGKNSFKSIKKPNIPVSLGALSVFGKGEEVTPSSLIEKGIISLRSGSVPTVKILFSKDDVSSGLVIRDCAVSKTAKLALLKAGALFEVNTDVGSNKI